ncbi:unnamed protein product [Bursaphelenchus xylophilus]|uniref:(pine wood nematode) hypothetical protein n=1 Tax=Bursaphelenchus xylophilus TaxID=6326 RepID=A0A1I7SS65_BURXY|nr:unnamed protein product [Bursaphelenchus xylophilus]CAG9105594.1 unnamed protein product [Bursaphelenchus xylophilus]
MVQAGCVKLEKSLGKFEENGVCGKIGEDRTDGPHETASVLTVQPRTPDPRKSRAASCLHKKPARLSTTPCFQGHISLFAFLGFIVFV